VQDESTWSQCEAVLAGWGLWPSAFLDRIAMREQSSMHESGDGSYLVFMRERNVVGCRCMTSDQGESPEACADINVLVSFTLLLEGMESQA
jgi:hypothetical protein